MSKRYLAVAGLLCAAISSAQAQLPAPVIGSILNAASGGDATPSGLAPGALFTISAFFGVSPELSSSVPTIQVQPVGGVTTTIPVLKTGAVSLTARLPESFPLGAADFTIVQDGLRGNPVRVPFRNTSLGLYRRWNSSPGQGIAQNIAQDQTATLNTMTNPAQPGGMVTLWGTGLGDATAEGISVSVGNATVPALSAGHVAASPGMDQITFQLPSASLQAGCYVPVTVAGIGWTSNEVTLSIANAPGACSHPLGLTADMLARLDDGDAIPFATGSMDSDAGVAPFRGAALDESVTVYFRRAAAAEIDTLSAGRCNGWRWRPAWWQAYTNPKRHSASRSSQDLTRDRQSHLQILPELHSRFRSSSAAILFRSRKN